MKPTIRRVGDMWEFVADNLLIRLLDREEVLALAWEHVLEVSGYHPEPVSAQYQSEAIPETTTPAPVAGASSGPPQDSTCAGAID